MAVHGRFKTEKEARLKMVQIKSTLSSRRAVRIRKDRGIWIVYTQRKVRG